jgi:fucose 4-O-acetylase-like acetyltransferase
VNSWSYHLSRAFNLSYLKTTRYKWVDYLKGIAILLIVYRHVLIGIERAGLFVPSYLSTANMIFYSFRMPLFFILSGMFISISLQKRSWGEVIFLKFKNIVYPYFIWVFIQVTLQIALSSFTNANRGLIDYVYIFYHPRELDQFWYLPALFNVTLIYSFVKIKLKPAVWMQLLAGVLLYFSSRYFNQVSLISDWMEFYLYFAIGDAASAFLFNEKRQELLKRSYILLPIIVAFIFIQLYYISKPQEFFLANWWGRAQFIFISLFGSFAMFVMAVRIQEVKVLSFLRIIGFHSLYIYSMHVLVAALTRGALIHFFHIQDARILLFTGIIISIPVCIAFYNIAIKEGRLWFLFFMKKPGTTRKEKQL